MRLKNNLAADGAIIGTTMIWGSTFVVAREILEVWPPFAYLAWRFAMATALLFLLFPREVLRARAPEWKAGAVLGILMSAGIGILTVGQLYTTPSKSAFIVGLTTPLVPFVAFAILRIRPSRENLIGVVLATLGGAFILAPRSGQGVNFGDALTLGCTILFAFHITAMSVYTKQFSARQLTTLHITVVGAVCMMVWLVFRALVAVFGVEALPQFITREAAPLIWSDVQILWQLIYMAVVATIITFLLWTWGQARMSATHASIIFSLEPVFATLFAVWVRGVEAEWIGWRGIFGAALILAGVLVSEMTLSEAKSKERAAEMSLAE
jgi:drug/metabolite transporter (DMT)-like permease